MRGECKAKRKKSQPNQKFNFFFFFFLGGGGVVSCSCHWFVHVWPGVSMLYTAITQPIHFPYLFLADPFKGHIFKVSPRCNITIYGTDITAYPLIILPIRASAPKTFFFAFCHYKCSGITKTRKTVEWCANLTRKKGHNPYHSEHQVGRISDNTGTEVGHVRTLRTSTTVRCMCLAVSYVVRGMCCVVSVRWHMACDEGHVWHLACGVWWGAFVVWRGMACGMVCAVAWHVEWYVPWHGMWCAAWHVPCHVTFVGWHVLCSWWFEASGEWLVACCEKYVSCGLWLEVRGMCRMACSVWIVVCGLWWRAYGVWHLAYGEEYVLCVGLQPEKNKLVFFGKKRFFSRKKHSLKKTGQNFVFFHF